VFHKRANQKSKSAVNTGSTKLRSSGTTITTMRATKQQQQQKTTLPQRYFRLDLFVFVLSTLSERFKNKRGTVPN